MVELKGFRHVTYPDFQSVLNNAFVANEKSYAELMLALKADSLQTAKNVLNKERQIVSDQKLTTAMKCIGVSGIVVWIFGARHYYLKLK